MLAPPPVPYTHPKPQKTLQSSGMRFAGCEGLEDLTRWWFPSSCESSLVGCGVVIDSEESSVLPQNLSHYSFDEMSQ